jgi:hypothetical protein
MECSRDSLRELLEEAVKLMAETKDYVPYYLEGRIDAFDRKISNLQLNRYFAGCPKEDENA